MATVRVLSKEFTIWFCDICASHGVVVRGRYRPHSHVLELDCCVPGNAVRALVTAALEAHYRDHSAELNDLVHSVAIRDNTVYFEGFALSGEA